MNKKMKWLAVAPLIFAASSGLTSCSDASGYLLLRVINSEDYIYLQEDESEPEDMVVQFEKSEAVQNYLDELATQEGKHYKGVKVIYDTSDTNETLYSELQTGKSHYDLMNVYDYMAQKIVSGKMAIPLYQNGNTIPKYETYASASVKGILDAIKAPQYDKPDIVLADYAVGYMWGTLGLLFNPDYPGFSGLEFDEIINDMQSVEALWNSKYKGTISVKNSMRDTYALGVLYTYKDEFAEIKTKYENGTMTLQQYKDAFSDIFNRCDEKSVSEVKLSLDALKENVFGLEVDSGKQDIITKKIGINFAWSGDAVYSMDQGEDLTQVSEEVELYYSVPELGSNVWMDVWVMPDCDRSEEQYKLAHMFLDFLSDPVNAAQNMNYTGYTSFVAGDSILELVRDWYDYRTGEIYVDEEFQVYSYDAVSGDIAAIDYSDFSRDNNDRDNELLYYSEEELEDVPTTVDDLLPVMVEEEDEEGNIVEVHKTYGMLSNVTEMVAAGELETVDLRYFFKDTIEEYDLDADAIFYSDCYLPFTYEDEEGVEHQNISVGRQFFCQYPNEETLNRCAVMKDYGENNKYVMKMWENFKSNNLPTWATVLFIVIIAGAVALIAYFVINSLMKKSTRKKRIENN